MGIAWDDSPAIAHALLGVSDEARGGAGAGPPGTGPRVQVHGQTRAREGADATATRRWAEAEFGRGCQPPGQLQLAPNRRCQAWRSASTAIWAARNARAYRLIGVDMIQHVPGAAVAGVIAPKGAGVAHAEVGECKEGNTIERARARVISRSPSASTMPSLSIGQVGLCVQPYPGSAHRSIRNRGRGSADAGNAPNSYQIRANLSPS